MPTLLRVPAKPRAQKPIIKSAAPTKREKLTIRLMIWLGLGFMGIFVWWFFNPEFIGYKPLYWVLTSVLMFKLLRMLHEWYHYYNIGVPEPLAKWRPRTVDMLTTACPGEPHEMILETLQAMVNVTYPHTTYLCDEGDDPALKEACRKMGVVHVTRTIKKDAKAGNINNALQLATGEIAVILDPDHVPDPQFLDRVLPYFEDEEVGYVQVVQAYKNQDESLIARAAAEQTYVFYGPMQMCMHTYGTAQAIGANCCFRRSALDSIGGHAAGLSEDMHTAMQLHAKGWKSVYVPEILTRGLVPASLSAYYKQQLKWSRGTFELLFVTYPKLFSKFTWRQKLHYFTLPLYYLFGLFDLLSIAVPIVSLFLAKVPWQFDMEEFALAFFPLIGVSMLIRQYAQRWLLEEHERGLQLFGGLMRVGTWWVFLLGFVYAVLRVNVPYIPTPKDDKLNNEWLLSMPNLAVSLLSIAAAIYGLSIDWSPYSIFMAGFALFNATLFGIVVLMGQQRFLVGAQQWLSKSTFDKYLLHPVHNKVINLRNWAYSFMRHKAATLATCIVIAFISMAWVQQNLTTDPNTLATPEVKDTGGFYTGIYLPQLDRKLSINEVEKVEKTVSKEFNIVSFYHGWGEQSITGFPVEELQQLGARGVTPMITWEPWPFHKGETKPVMAAILAGNYDEYIKRYAQLIAKTGVPMYLRFGHEPENPFYPWSPEYGNSPEKYVAAWRYVVDKFRQEGVTNVAWVWNPWKHTTMLDYYPGDDYVDWIGVTALNYGQAYSDHAWRTFDDLYEPFRSHLTRIKKPVMLAEFGTTEFGGDKAAWLKYALYNISFDYPEIKAVVFFNSDRDKNWPNEWRPDSTASFIDWSFTKSTQTSKVVKRALAQKHYKEQPYHSQQPASEVTSAYTSKFVKGNAGNYTLQVQGKPFYIKGVVYNPSHNWRDGNHPLTRDQLEKDLHLIKKMGANTIRRYSSSFYDRNILTVAEANDLKVLYGFWLSPDVDYNADTLELEKYMQEVEKVVQTYKDNPAVLGWSVGNEVWQLLDLYYEQPYLARVRQQYVAFVEKLAIRIHKLDPDRPVFTVLRHNDQLAAALRDFKTGAPSIDVISISSFKEDDLSGLDEVMAKHYPEKPYMVSEFGYKGYWNPDYSNVKAKDKAIEEDQDYEKGRYYKQQWEQHIKANKGRNIGGFAFCWRDRMEGTATWSGITDFKGRLKPTYFAMMEAYTGQKVKPVLPAVSIQSRIKGYYTGQTYTFKVAMAAKAPKGLKHEWYLYGNEYLDKIGSLEKMNGGKQVRIRLPEKASAYRLYLYVSDKNGNVVTASLPVAVN
ncbi:glycosyltransferase [Pontibacter vulgaris]|uniref:glycosyltransferase n=1 Tax=Pontibacter vulgaris TaxID=2905679 RepID=UPI001FA7A8B7|nr:glycosyltransferase [Pontibacter vulgaris]